MRFGSGLYLKWLEANSPALQGTHFNLTNLCMLLGRTTSGSGTGLTVFEPRDLTEGFFARLQARRKKSEFSGSRFSLYLPKFLEHRLQSLLHRDLRKDIEIIYTSFLNIRQGGDRFVIRDRLRVVNVDDSPVLLKFLKHTMEGFGFAEVVAQVSDPLQAVATIQKYKPDLITMDIQMPGLTGVDVVKRLLAIEHYPILMVSSLNLEEGSLGFEALNAGAFDFVQKPKLQDKAQFEEELSSKVLLAVGSGGHLTQTRKVERVSPSRLSTASIIYPDSLIWCLGASTGGTQALTRVFTSLPTRIPPTFVVQHIPPVFSKAFADSLNSLCPFEVKEAEDGEIVKTNTVYVAAGGLQMGVERRLGKLHIVLKDAPPINRFKPSVDYLFQDIARLDGMNVVAGVLTGMGRDGAQGLLELKNKGALTFVQDEESSAVFGMPRVAFEIGATDQVISLHSIAEKMLQESEKFRKAG